MTDINVKNWLNIDPVKKNNITFANESSTVNFTHTTVIIYKFNQNQLFPWSY